MNILNGKIGKKEIIIGTIIGVVIVSCSLIFCFFHEKEVYYQVIFDSMGGSEVAGQNVLVGSSAKYPSETKREGYIFEGWYQEDKKFDFGTKVREDIILKKKKKKEKKEILHEDKKEELKQEDKSKQQNESQQVQTPSKPVTVDVSGIGLNLNNITLRVGESSVLSADVQPGNATNKVVTWSSSNSNVVTVSNGTIIAVNAGTATITATAGGKSAICIVTVISPVTYSYEIVDAPGSAVGQCYIYIKSSDGKYVSGKINVTYKWCN